MKKRWMVYVAAVIGLSVSVQAGIVTFSEADGYTNGNSLVSGTLSPSGAGFSYAQTTGTVDPSNVIEGQALKITGGQGSASWVKDTNTTTYDDITGKWHRSIDVTVSGASAIGATGRVSVSLFNGTQGGALSLNNTTAYLPNLLLEVNIFKNSSANNALQIKRNNSSGVLESYDFDTGIWGTTVVSKTYDLGVTLNVAYVYDAELSQFAINVINADTEATLASLSVAESQLPSYVGGTNTVRFGAGDMWSNLSTGSVVTLDNLSTIPEPGTVSLFVISSAAILTIRRSLRNKG